MDYAFFQKPRRQTGVDWKTGLLKPQKGFCVNQLPVRMPAGSVLKPLLRGMRFRCYYYSEEIDERLVFSYRYHPESNWLIPFPNQTEREMACGERTAERNCFVRVLMREEDVPEDAGFKDLFQIVTKDGPELPPAWMAEETRRTVLRVQEKSRPGDLKFILLTDSHYAVGGNWEDTVRSIGMTAEQISPDGIIHLGDFTDGLLPGAVTEGIVREMLRDLEGICGNLLVCVGNHDLNYFRGNPDRFPRRRAAELYLGRSGLWYLKDYPEQKLRMFFLDSFDPEKKLRYGFESGEILWIARQLNKTPEDFRVLLFSHVPPAAKIHVWSLKIRGERRIKRILEHFSRKRSGAVLGWIHGHNHADQIIFRAGIPIIGTGCSKLESFPEHKPRGAETPRRVRNSSSQELWDVLLIHPEDGSMDLIRYGAGKDRHVSRAEQDSRR